MNILVVEDEPEMAPASVRGRPEEVLDLRLARDGVELRVEPARAYHPCSSHRQGLRTPPTRAILLSSYDNQRFAVT